MMNQPNDIFYREEMDRHAYFKRLQEIFDSAIAFRSGSGDGERWQIFFPGNDYYKGSAAQRNAAFNTFKTLNGKQSQYVGAPVDTRKIMLRIGAAQKHQAHGMECNEHFASFLGMLGDDHILNMPIVDCASFGLPEAQQLLTDYFKDTRIPVPARLDDAAPETNGRHAARHHHPHRVASPYRNVMHDHRLAMKRQKEQPASTFTRRVEPTHLRNGFIANLPNDGGLSLFVPSRTPLGPLREEIGVSCGINGEARHLKPKDREHPLIPGLHQIRININIAQALTQSVPLPLINNGQPASIDDIRQNIPQNIRSR